MKMEELKTKIDSLRLNFLYIARNNMFIGQDILPEENIIQELTGFSGSNAELLISKNKTYLFTDGRYELQAKKEVGKDIEVFIKNGDLHNILHKEKDSSKVKLGFNPWTTPINRFKYLEANGTIELIPTEIILSHSTIKTPKVFDLDIKYAGRSTEEKLTPIIDHMKIYNSDGYLFTSADSVSWLLNKRSDYLPNSPVLRAFALLNKNGELSIFSDDFEAIPFSELENEFKKYENKTVNVDENSPYIFKIWAEKYNINTINFRDICQSMKANKNHIEIENTKKAHLKDGIAVTKLLYWLENSKEEKSEISIANRLFDLRKQQELFFGNSFETIAGFGTNGAIVHYHPTEESNKRIETDNLLLLDSGAQYFDGTTDATRTIPFGNISQEMKDNYTLVLKAHIALANATFPINTKGEQLDMISRNIMWQQKKDYAHGTGHGVGFFLNVHEGPVSISPREGYFCISKDNILSIEPGYYQENGYGIRIENLYVVVEKDKKWLGFEYLTLIPIDTKALNYNLLNSCEIEWLKNYNNDVYNKLSKFLTTEEKEWLKGK